MGELVVCEVMIGVFGDYDGNAPDTDNLVVVGSQEEADAVIKDLKLVRDEEDKDGEARVRLEQRDVMIPYVEGCQSCLTFGTREVLVRAEGEFVIERNSGFLRGKGGV